jgi:hypothetical protein
VSSDSPYLPPAKPSPTRVEILPPEPLQPIYVEALRPHRPALAEFMDAFFGPSIARRQADIANDQARRAKHHAEHMEELDRAAKAGNSLHEHANEAIVLRATAKAIEAKAPEIAAIKAETVLANAQRELAEAQGEQIYSDRVRQQEQLLYDALNKVRVNVVDARGQEELAAALRDAFAIVKELARHETSIAKSKAEQPKTTDQVSSQSDEPPDYSFMLRQLINETQGRAPNANQIIFIEEFHRVWDLLGRTKQQRPTSLDAWRPVLREYIKDETRYKSCGDVINELKGWGWQ